MWRRFGCDFADLRFENAAILLRNRCACDFAIWASKFKCFQQGFSGFGRSKELLSFGAPSPGLFLANCQRIAKGAGGKGPRQKTSKIVKECQKYFRHFSTFFAQGKNVKNRQKVAKIFSTLFDNFRAAPVFRPLLGGSETFRPRKPNTPMRLKQVKQSRL